MRSKNNCSGNISHSLQDAYKNVYFMIRQAYWNVLEHHACSVSMKHS